MAHHTDPLAVQQAPAGDQAARNHAAAAHLSRIAGAQREIATIEAALDELAQQTRAKKQQHAKAVARLRELVDEAAGIRAMALPLGGQS